MALSQHEMFEKLLDQLDLAADVRQDPSLTSGTVQNVTIHEQSRRYDFTLGFDAILPFQTFNAIATKLPLVFQQIAATDLSVVVTQPTITDELLAQYWQYVVTHAEIGTGIVRELCEKQVPTLENDRAVIKTENEQIRQYLIQQGLGKLEETYRQVGFSGLRMQAEVDEEQAAQSMAAFQAQRAEETAKMAKAAAEVVKQQAAKQKQVQTDGPVQMGRQMKMTDAPQQMVTITQEERSVTVEGYVFDVEVRELRSKRQLLIFKVTDYSSSFIAKKFSNGPEDEAMFARIQKGQWLRVRGSVQEDNYSRELTINAQDI
ncbi:MAG: PolC-type DNA polymerase III N-terminal domain-containing protein, partial [Lacticaseibacillus paracasei]